jgi:translation initiation factor 2 alpha subunit (eIF-2alpha)
MDEDDINPEFIQEFVKDFPKYIIKMMLTEMINIEFNKLLDAIKNSVISDNKAFENDAVKNEILKEIYYSLQEQIQTKLLELENK